MDAIERAGAPGGRMAALALGGGFLLLLAAMIGVVLQGGRVANAQSWVQHTIEVRQNIQAVDAAVRSAEASQRGYIITRDPGYLAETEAAQGQAHALMAHLGWLTRDNPRQVARHATLVPIVEQRFERLNRGIALERSGDHAGAVTFTATGGGKEIMQQIQVQLAAYDEEEVRLYQSRLRRAATEQTISTTALAVALAAALALMLGVLFVTRRYLAALVTQNAALIAERSERERVEAQLRQAQKMEALGQLTGGVAHDFNNMLAIIVGSLDMLLRRIDQGPERIRQLANNALDGAKRAGQLTQRLLAFSRQAPLDPSPLDPNRVVNGMMSMLGSALGERVIIETVLGAGVWRIHADEPQLESALLNLCVNARDAMGEGGKLTIETTNSFLDERYARDQADVESGQYVLISVTDTGHGMPADIAERAFDPFFTTKASGSGTGLGLSQVHGFLKQSGGHIKIYSELNVGTTIKLYFPRYVGSDVVAVDQQSSSEREPLGCTVLLVEDEAGVRSFVAEALHELGCKVVEAENAEGGLAKLDAHPEITLLITDVVMPGKSGRELADLALQRRADLRVLYMTGYTRNAIVHNGMLDPGTHLLSKPFTLADLEVQLHKLLRRAPST